LTVAEVTVERYISADFLKTTLVIMSGVNCDETRLRRSSIVELNKTLSNLGVSDAELNMMSRWDKVRQVALLRSERRCPVTAICRECGRVVDEFVGNVCRNCAADRVTSIPMLPTREHDQ